MKAPRTLLAVAFSAAFWSSASSAPKIGLETHVVLTIDALTLAGERSKSAGVAREVEIGPSQPGAVEFTLPWGRDERPILVRLDARLTSLTGEGEAVLICESRVTRAGHAPVLASREIRLADEGSGLFEVFGDGERRLLLTLRGEQVSRAVVRPLANVGAAVRFKIAIERVDGERIVLLETNDLHTFVGQSVEYSFRQGQDERLEAVRFALLPVSISGDLVTIDAEISGALPSASGTALVSRRERIIASKRATTSVAATTGMPPAGYRFQVTPDF